VLWNQGVHTDTEVTKNNNLKQEKTCILIDVAIPVDRNAMQQEAEKKLKYKSLCIENVECEMYDYTGNNWKNCISNKRFKVKFGSQSRKTFDSLKKVAVLGTSHIIWKVLQSET
jgi:hypothetical protein